MLPFPWILLAEYESFVNVGAIMRHEVRYDYSNLYCCQWGDVVEMDGNYWLVLCNNAYAVVCQNLHDKSKEERLPTVACYIIGHVNINKGEKVSC